MKIASFFGWQKFHYAMGCSFFWCGFCGWLFWGKCFFNTLKFWNFRILLICSWLFDVVNERNFRYLISWRVSTLHFSWIFEFFELFKSEISGIHEEFSIPSLKILLNLVKMLIDSIYPPKNSPKPSPSLRYSWNIIK